jgi:hypothetical protein
VDEPDVSTTTATSGLVEFRWVETSSGERVRVVRNVETDASAPMSIRIPKMIDTSDLPTLEHYRKAMAQQEAQKLQLETALKLNQFRSNLIESNCNQKAIRLSKDHVALSQFYGLRQMAASTDTVGL